METTRKMRLWVPESGRLLAHYSNEIKSKRELRAVIRFMEELNKIEMDEYRARIGENFRLPPSMDPRGVGHVRLYKSKDSDWWEEILGVKAVPEPLPPTPKWKSAITRLLSKIMRRNTDGND